MSLYDRASLIQVPSLYKDGTLVSTVPEDRSGDFAVARGSNLSATRIGEDGYIKKGYENLLLQSNNFSDGTWIKSGIDTPTGGQAGYDGTNDAWLLEKTASSGVLIKYQTLNITHCLNVYAKAGTLNWIRIRIGTSGDNAYFNLDPNATGSRIGAFTDDSAQIKDIGNGWFRCSVSYSGSVDRYRIYPADDAGDVSGTSGSIYIQDAQINQGLVAYPYLETTDAPAQGGLLENTPRLDWSNGVPAVLVEESRTNFINNSEYLSAISGVTLSNVSLSYTATTSPENVGNAHKLIVSNVTNFPTRLFVQTQGAGSQVVSVFAKAGEVNSIAVSSYTGSGYLWAAYNLTNGSFISATADDYGIEDYGNGWYRVWVYVANSTNRYAQISIGDSADTLGNGFFLADGNGSNGLYLYGFQVEQDVSTPSSYIPTYGTTQTRSSETVSDTFSIPTTATIYNSFYAPASEQVYILDQVFSVSEGLNKVAIAFSPTAVKISVGGAIVASSTGSYDTTSLTSISLGSDSGADYSNAPISGFYVFPEFLTDLELNSLTA